MDQDEFSIVEDYLHRNQYPKGILKEDKANVRCNCKNFKFALFQKSKERKGDEEGWKICVTTEEEKKMHSQVMSCCVGLKVKQKVYTIQ